MSLNPSAKLHTARDNGEPEGHNPTLHEPISVDGTPVLGQLYTVPARNGRAVRLRKGQVIRIINTHGSQVCDTWAFNSADLSEFMSMEHVRAWIDRIVPQPGDALVTNQRRPILTLLSDTSPGVHDTLIAPCDLSRYRTLGVEIYHDNCADNLRMALGAIGLRSGEVPCALNLWMNIPVDRKNAIQWLPPVSQAGDHVELRAEMDCVLVMSACPQDIVAINAHNPVDVHFVVEGSD
ncbi:urea carboxylase-associated family protein [Xylophilus sp. GW821-FHT01B05]